MLTFLLLLEEIEDALRIKQAIDTIEAVEAKDGLLDFMSTKRQFAKNHQCKHAKPQTCPKPKDEKVFGVNVRVDEPRAKDYTSRRKFLEDHANFDKLVEAAERCNWNNKSNSAPLHKVNATRRRIEDGPVLGKDLIGETDWWWV